MFSPCSWQGGSACRPTYHDTSFHCFLEGGRAAENRLIVVSCRKGSLKKEEESMEQGFLLVGCKSFVLGLMGALHAFLSRCLLLEWVVVCKQFVPVDSGCGELAHGGQTKCGPAVAGIGLDYMLVVLD